MSEKFLEELLAEHADRLIADEADATLWQSAGPEARELMALAGKVSRVLRPVEPSPRFVSRLRRDLVGRSRSRAFAHIRLQLPTVRLGGEVWGRITDALARPYLAGAIGVALLAIVLVRLRSLQSALAKVRLPFGRQRSAVTA